MVLLDFCFSFRLHSGLEGRCVQSITSVNLWFDPISLCLARDSLPLDLPGQPYTHLFSYPYPSSMSYSPITSNSTKIVLNYDELLLLTWGLITNCKQYANLYIYIYYIYYIYLYYIYIYYLYNIYIYIILIIRYTNPWTYPQLHGFWMNGAGAQVDQGPRGWHLFGHQHHRGLLRRRVAWQP